jgi:hypothetical protein
MPEIATMTNINLSSLNLKRENQEILTNLINNDQKQYDHYVNDYHGKYPNQLIAVANFRLHKRQRSIISYLQFADMYSGDTERKRLGLQTFFQYPVIINDVIRLDKLIKDGQIDLREVYDRSMSDLHLTPVRLLHDRRYCLKIKELLERNRLK